jgi:hypothetical protein
MDTNLTERYTIESNEGHGWLALESTSSLTEAGFIVDGLYEGEDEDSETLHRVWDQLNNVEVPTL